MWEPFEEEPLYDRKIVHCENGKIRLITRENNKCKPDEHFGKTEQNIISYIIIIINTCSNCHPTDVAAR